MSFCSFFSTFLTDGFDSMIWFFAVSATVRCALSIVCHGPTAPKPEVLRFLPKGSQSSRPSGVPVHEAHVSAWAPRVLNVWTAWAWSRAVPSDACFSSGANPSSTSRHHSSVDAAGIHVEFPGYRTSHAQKFGHFKRSDAGANDFRKYGSTRSRLRFEGTRKVGKLWGSHCPARHRSSSQPSRCFASCQWFRFLWGRCPS